MGGVTLRNYEKGDRIVAATDAKKLTKFYFLQRLRQPKGQPETSIMEHFGEFHLILSAVPTREERQRRLQAI